MSTLILCHYIQWQIDYALKHDTVFLEFIETMLRNPQLLVKGVLGNPKAKYWGKTQEIFMLKSNKRNRLYKFLFFF